MGKGKNMVAHFNEWTVGMGLLYLKSKMPKIATVFTTHATSIGRSICGNNKPLYDYMSGYNGDQMAEELNINSIPAILFINTNGVKEWSVGLMTKEEFYGKIDAALK